MAQGGFSMIEAVATLVLVSTLSVYAYTRFVDRSSLEAVGYFNELKTGVRYAQSLAKAKRRTVCVVLTGSSFALSYASAEGGGSACGQSVPDPSLKSSSFQRVAPEGVSLTAQTLRFDSKGQPVDGAGAPLSSATILTQVDAEATRTLTVEAVSGFVHS